MGVISLEFNLFSDVSVQLSDRNANLLHRVAVANRYAAVFLRIEVVSDAERGADLVLAAVTLADRTCLGEPRPCAARSPDGSA